MTANERALLDELLSMHAEQVRGSESLRAMFERTLEDTQAVMKRLNELSVEVERLEGSLKRLTPR